MKKFFKALALVLALTLVVGTIPASAAEYEFSLKKEKKIIYLGGAQGEKEEDGATVKCGTKSRYKISKLVEGFDASTMDIKLESSDKSIVKTSNAKDKVYAKSIGVADVTIYVYDKETGKLLKNLTVKVQVKKNATAPLNVIITDIEGNPVDLTATKAGVNVPYIVTLPRRGADGAFVDTDYRSLTVDDESVSIEPANKYGTQYKVTFTKAGTFKFTAASYQSSIWNKLQNVVTVPVTAGYDAVAVEQSGLDTVKVVFDTPVAGLEKANFNAYYKISDVVIPYSDVDTITYDANDKNVAYVKFLSNFIANTEFTIQYDKKDIGSFKAIAVTVDSVKTVLIPVQKVEAGVETDLKYQLLADGDIDVTSGVLALGGMINFEIVNDDFKNYVTSQKVYISNAGDSITVKGTYTYWDSDNNQKTVVGEGQIVAVAAAEWQIGAVTGKITARDAADLINADGSINGDVKEINFTMDDPYGAALQITVPYTKGSTTVNEGFYATDAEPALYANYSAKVADETVILLDACTSQRLYLIANKAGSTQILIYGVKADGSEVVIGAIPVVVKEQRKIGSWTVTASKSNVNLSFGDDTVSYEVLVKDQDGQAYTKAFVAALEDTSTNKDLKIKNYSVAYDNANGKATITVKASDVVGAGVHNLKVTVDADAGKVVRLSAAEDGAAVRYLLKLSGNALKTGIKTDTKNSSITIGLEGLSKTGSAAAVASGVALQFTNAQPKATAKADYKGVTGYVYTITKDGKLMDKAPATKVGDTTIYAFDNSVTNASTAAVKLEKGTYVVTAYNIELNGAGTSYVPTPVGTPQTFTVTDDQAEVVVKKNSKAEKISDLYDADQVIGAFDITFGGTDINKIDGVYVVGINGNVNADHTTAYIKDITVRIESAIGYWDIKVDVDTLVKKG